MKNGTLQLILTFALLTHTASATAQTLLPPKPFEPRFEKFKTLCLNESRAFVPVQKLDRSQLGYRVTALDAVFGNWIGKPIHDGVDHTRRAFQSQEQVRADQAKLARVDAALREFYARYPQMNAFQKACAATCASAHLIEYEALTANDVEVPSSIVSRGVGLCRHFAETADYLMKDAGVSSILIGGTDEQGGAHAWVQVRIDGKRYWMEPQLDRCNFYRR